MLKKIIEFSIKNKLIVGLMVIGLVVYGLIELTRLPIDAVPDITDNQVQIITRTPSLGAPDVERFITFPIEQSCSNIPGLKEMRSFSRFGLSVVTIIFDEQIDLYWARQQVGERLQLAQSQIPKSFGMPELGPITTGLGEIYQYVVRPEKGFESKYNTTELRTIQDWVVRRQLLGVKGVAEVASFGGHLKQYEVSIIPSKLAAHKLSIQDVMNVLEANNQNTGGAYIEKGPTVLFIRSEGLIGDKADISNIVVKYLENGSPLFIRDIAEVNIGSAIRYGAMTYNGEVEVSGAVVMMLKGANSNLVIKDVKNRIAQIQKSLPEGVVIEPFLDRTKMVNNSISTVSKNLIEGALIVVFVLVLFLGNFRAGLLVASVIPLSMLFAIIMMNVFGVSGNLMSLGALDFGLIVDGAVIIVEAVLHSLQHSKVYGNRQLLTQSEMNQEVSNSSGKMMNSAVFGQVIILIVYLPILTLKGIEGKMFKPMAQTVAFALIGAFILSLTYIPMMSSLFLSKKTTHKRNFSDVIIEKLQEWYRLSLVYVLNKVKLTLILVSLAFFSAVIILLNLGGEFIPSLPEGDFAVETRVLPGSNLKTSVDAMLKSEKLLLDKFPEVIKVVGKTGSSEIPTDPMPIEASDMMVILKDKKDWTSADNYNDLAAMMTKELETIPGVYYSFQYPVSMRFNELMTGARQDVVCKIFGENMDTLSKYAKQLSEMTKTIEGSDNIYLEPVTGMPQIVIKFNRNLMAQYGVNIESVNQVVNASFAGQSIGMVYEDEKRFDLVVRLQSNERQGLENVQNLFISTPNGHQLPLSTFAEVKVVDGINQIQRENAHRRIIVGFNVRNRDVQSTVNDLKKKVDHEFKLPTGYYLTFGGAFENLNEARARLSIAVPVSLVLIFVLLYFAFQSLKLGLLIYTAIPLSAIGGVFALAIRGMPFSISAGVGFIALFGVAVLNGIVLIAEFNRQKSLGISDLKEIVLLGGVTRLRPVLMTAFVASLGFLPMALSNGEGAEVQRPLATVVIGGLMLATFLTLYVLPILFIIFNKGVFVKKVIKPLVLCTMFFMSSVLYSQNEISLQSAIDSALTNNVSLKTEKAKADYLNQLKYTNWNIPQTEIGVEYGQLNSVYNDNSFFITQNLMFPTIYTAQKKLTNNQWKEALFDLEVKENDLKRHVRSVFFEMLNIHLKIEMLQKTDSIYQVALSKSELRFKSGESNVLELKTIELQRENINFQLMSAQRDFKVLQYQFKWLINTQEVYLPDKKITKLNFNELKDTTILNQHPLLLRILQQEKKYISELDLSKQMYLPNLMLSYKDMSMLGVGANNVNYENRSSRFRSIQIGVGVPLFFGSNKAEVESKKLQLKINQSDYQNQLQQLQTIQLQISEKYVNQFNMINYFETQALQNAKILQQSADAQFYNGAINYIEWMTLTHQSISIQYQYIEALQELNELSIQLYTIHNL
ncbi:MAG: CusA/CzcA family heavy metal efflux RND transporter [Bacteroidota bacterium]|nr:CusA/CzcA family heavy metal efflux RND transporter [Bacteroidota bacterium]